MSIQVICPHCKGTMEAKEELLGTQARCPFCMQTCEVKRAPASPPPEPSKPTGAVEVPLPGGSAIPPKGGTSTNDPRPAIRWDDKVTNDRSFSRPQQPQAAPQLQAFAPTGLVLSTSSHHRRKRNLVMVVLNSVVRRGNPTDVSVVITGLVAAVITWLFYVTIVVRLPDAVRELLSERTWVQKATVYFTIWAAIVLVVKFWKIAHQRSSLSYSLLPVDQETKITPANVDLVVGHIRKLPVNPRKNFLINRILLALENFKARKNVQEVGAVLNSQADTDGNMVDSSYAMLKVLIWVIPILGFLGTVIGISAAVQNFTGDVGKAGEFKGVQDALKGVTNGLATAFDTTYLGLILSIVIMFPTNWVQKLEDDLLSTIDQYCDENLLPRLAVESVIEVDEKAEIEKEMRSVAVMLQDWLKRLENLESALFEKVVDSLGEIRKELAATRGVPEEIGQ